MRSSCLLVSALVCFAFVVVALPPSEARGGCNGTNCPPPCYYSCPQPPAVPELCSLAGACEPCPSEPALPDGAVEAYASAVPCAPRCGDLGPLPACARDGHGGGPGDP